MNITLRATNDFYKGAEQTLCEIANLSKDTHKKIVVIVPDKFSFFAEQEILSHVESYFNISVVGLNYLTKSLAKDLSSLSPTGQLCFVYGAIKNVQSSFEYFSKTLLSHDFCQHIQTCLNMFMSSEVEISSVSGGDDALSKKIRDLSKIFNEYKKLLNGTLDQNSLQKVAIENIKDENFSDCDVFFVGFDDLTKQGISLFLKICKTAKSSTIIAQRAEYTQKNGYLFGSDFFDKVKNALLDCDLSFKTETMFFHGTIQNILATGIELENVYAFRPKNLKQECDIVAREILVRTYLGEKLDDICVVCSCLQDQKDELLRAFNKLAIPYFFDSEEKICKSFCAGYLLSAINLFQNGKTRASVLNYLDSSSLFSDEVKLEMKRLMRKHRFGENKNFYKTLESENIDALPYKTLERECDRLIGKFKNAYVDLFDEQFLESYKRFKQSGFFDSSYEDACLLQIKNYIAEIGELFCNGNYSKEFVCDAFKFFVTSATIKSKPISSNTVHVFDLCDSFYRPHNTTFFIGQTSRLVFRKTTESSYIKDSDISALKDVCNLGPSAKSVNEISRAKTLYNFLQLKHVVYISAPSEDECGGCESSVLFDYVMKHCKVEDLLVKYNIAKVFKCKKLSEVDYIRLFSTKESLLSCYETLTNSYKAEEISKTLLAVIKKSEENQQKKLNYLENNISVSMLETFYKCPYLCFLENILRLNQDDDTTLNYLVRGNMFHSVFEKFLKNYKDLPACDIDKTIAFLFDCELKKQKDVDKENNKFLIFRLKENFKKFAHLLDEEKKVCSFTPTEFEKKFELNNFYDGKKLVGKIDRIDVCGGDYRLIDYKTGRIEIGDATLYYGEKMQLFVYALAFSTLPKGLLYADVKSFFEGKSSSLYVGCVVGGCEDAILQDGTLAQGKKGRFLPLKVGKGGKIETKSDDEIKKMIAYAKNLMQRGAELIDEGFFEKTPLLVKNLPCDSCTFKCCCPTKFERKAGFGKRESSKLDVFSGKGENDGI